MRPPIEEYTDINDWSKPLIDRLIEQRRKIPKEERLKMFRNDSADEVDTSDLENITLRGIEHDPDHNVWKRTGDSLTQAEEIDQKIKMEGIVKEQVKEQLSGKIKFRTDEFDIMAREREE